MPKRESYADRIIREVCEALDDGRLTEGDPLPSQRQWCDQYAVSRSTVQRVVRDLGALGLTESHQGVAVYLRQGARRRASGLIARSAVASKTERGSDWCPQSAPIADGDDRPA